jgi:uncharacterized damage-inducible protein DinB
MLMTGMKVMTKDLRVAVLVAGMLCVLTTSGFAQSAALQGIRGEFADVRKAVMTAANKAPESLYGYQPTPEVFTFRKMLLHIADASYYLCAGFQQKGAERPKVDANEDASKQKVLETLTAAFSYCDATMAVANDATLAEVVTAPSGTQRPKSYYLSHLIAHTSLHYGNLVTYMRLNKLSPGAD